MILSMPVDIFPTIPLPVATVINPTDDLREGARVRTASVAGDSP
jgi:hypothetical protein